MIRPIGLVIILAITLSLSSIDAQPRETTVINQGKTGYYLPVRSLSSPSSFQIPSTQRSWTPSSSLATAVNGLFISARIHTGDKIESIIELFNPSSSSVTTQGYLLRVSRAYRGTEKRTWQHTSVLNFYLPNTTITAHSSVVICHPNNRAQHCDLQLTSSVGNQKFTFNGNDAIALVHGNTIIDEFGDVSDAMDGKDGWSVATADAGTVTTSQRTFYRTSSVYRGTTWASSIASNEWIIASRYDVSQLHNHPYQGRPSWSAVNATQSLVQVSNDVKNMKLDTSVMVVNSSRYISTLAMMIPSGDVLLQDLKLTTMVTDPITLAKSEIGSVIITQTTQSKWTRNKWQYITLHTSKYLEASSHIHILIATKTSNMAAKVRGYIFDAIIVADEAFTYPKHEGNPTTTATPTTTTKPTVQPTTAQPTTRQPTTTAPTTMAPTTQAPTTVAPTSGPTPSGPGPRCPAPLYRESSGFFGITPYVADMNCETVISPSGSTPSTDVYWFRLEFAQFLTDFCCDVVTIIANNADGTTTPVFEHFGTLDPLANNTMIVQATSITVRFVSDPWGEFRGWVLAYATSKVAAPTSVPQAQLPTTCPPTFIDSFTGDVTMRRYFQNQHCITHLVPGGIRSSTPYWFLLTQRMFETEQQDLVTITAIQANGTETIAFQGPGVRGTMRSFPMAVQAVALRIAFDATLQSRENGRGFQFLFNATLNKPFVPPTPTTCPAPLQNAMSGNVTMRRYFANQHCSTDIIPQRSGVPSSTTSYWFILNVLPNSFQTEETDIVTITAFHSNGTSSIVFRGWGNFRSERQFPFIVQATRINIAFDSDINSFESGQGFIFTYQAQTTKPNIVRPFTCPPKFTGAMEGNVTMEGYIYDQHCVTEVIPGARTATGNGNTIYWFLLELPLFETDWRDFLTITAIFPNGTTNEIYRRAGDMFASRAFPMVIQASKLRIAFDSDLESSQNGQGFNLLYKASTTKPIINRAFTCPPTFFNQMTADIIMDGYVYDQHCETNVFPGATGSTTTPSPASPLYWFLIEVPYFESDWNDRMRITALQRDGTWLQVFDDTGTNNRALRAFPLAIQGIAIRVNFDSVLESSQNGRGFQIKYTASKTQPIITRPSTCPKTIVNGMSGNVTMLGYYYNQHCITDVVPVAARPNTNHWFLLNVTFLNSMWMDELTITAFHIDGSSTEIVKGTGTAWPRRKFPYVIQAKSIRVQFDSTMDSEDWNAESGFGFDFTYVASLTKPNWVKPTTCPQTKYTATQGNIIMQGYYADQHCIMDIIPTGPVTTQWFLLQSLKFNTDFSDIVTIYANQSDGTATEVYRNPGQYMFIRTVFPILIKATSMRITFDSDQMSPETGTGFNFAYLVSKEQPTIPPTPSPFDPAPTAPVPTTPVPTTSAPTLAPITTSTVTILSPVRGATQVPLTTTITFKVDRVPTRVALFYTYRLNSGSASARIPLVPATNTNTTINKSFDIQLSAITPYHTLRLEVWTSQNAQLGTTQVVTFTAITALQAPETVQISATPTTATLTWQDPNSGLDAASITYVAEMRVQRDDGTFASWTRVKATQIRRIGTSRQYTLSLSGLVAATHYHVSIRATNAKGSSAWVTFAFHSDGFIRRPAHRLSSVEKRAYAEATRLLADEYHVMTLQHDVAFGVPNRAHGGPVFLPWHRVYLLRIESALKRVINREQYGQHYGITFWDWPQSDSVEQLTHIFNDEFMGGDGDPQTGLVATGPFASCLGRGLEPGCDTHEWQPVEGTAAQSDPFTPEVRTDGLRRRIQWDNLGMITHRRVINEYLSTNHTFLEFSMECENWHNSVHMYIGGDMTSGTSPNDPMFYQHHCNVDKLWWEFQQKYPQVQYDPDRSAPDSEDFYAYTAGQRWNSKMIFQEGKDELNQWMVDETMDYNALGMRYVMDWNHVWGIRQTLSGTINVPMPLNRWTGKIPTNANITGSSFTSATVYHRLNSTYLSWHDFELRVTVQSASDLFFVQFLNQDGDVIEFASSTTPTINNIPTTVSSKLVIASSHRSLGEFITIAIQAQGAVTVTNVQLIATANPVPEQTGLQMATQSTSAKTQAWLATTSEVQQPTEEIIIMPQATTTTTAVAISSGTIAGIVIAVVVAMMMSAAGGYVFGTRRSSVHVASTRKMFAQQEGDFQTNPAVAMTRV